MQHTYKSSGFTLVELMVSVAITAILMVGIAAFFSSTFRHMFMAREEVVSTQGQFTTTTILDGKFANVDQLDKVGPGGAWAVIQNNMETGDLPFTYIGAQNGHLVMKDFFVFNGRHGFGESANTDISNPAAVCRMVERALAEFGRIDILINNAGGPLAGVCSISPASQEEFFETMASYTFEHISADDFAAILSVNFYGPLHCIRCVLPVMQRQGAGSILNITSKSGMMKYGVVPGMSAYASAKAALSRFTEVLAFELACAGSSVRVNALSPGMVAVSFHENLPPEERELFRKPEDIRESLLNILDDHNTASGEVFTEDGTTWYAALREE